MAKHMAYEVFLGEVTTLITEKYDVADKAAIAMVMATCITAIRPQIR